MKNILLVLSFLLLAGMTFGQIKVNTNGFTKIGDTGVAPTSQLHVKAATGNAFGTEIFKVEDTDGNFRVAEGTSTPNAFLPTFFFNSSGIDGVAGGFTASLPPANDVTGNPIAAGIILDARRSDNTPLVGSKLFMIRNFGLPKLTMLANGNVGIGDNNIAPTEKLSVSGNIVATGTVTWSDINLKNTLKSFSGGLDQINSLNTVTFKYNEKSGLDTDETHIGLIAQEVQEIAPYLVGSTTMTTFNGNTEKYLEQGPLSEADIAKDIESRKVLYIKESEIKYLLINAVQEQQEKISQQNDRIEKLEEAIKALLEANSHSMDIELGAAGSKSRLDQNQPNPFSDETSISYFIPENTESAIINIFDTNGRLIKSVDVNNVGEGNLNINSLNLPSGAYNYNLIVNDKLIGTKRMIQTK